MGGFLLLEERERVAWTPEKESEAHLHVQGSTAAQPPSISCSGERPPHFKQGAGTRHHAWDRDTHTTPCLTWTPTFPIRGWAHDSAEQIQAEHPPRDLNSPSQGPCREEHLNGGDSYDHSPRAPTVWWGWVRTVLPEPAAPCHLPTGLFSPM